MDLSSMVDVSFLLLIFFIVTSTIQSQERDLSMNVPTPGEASHDLTLLPIEIRSNGNIVLAHEGETELLSSDQQDRKIFKLESKLTQLRDLGLIDTVSVSVTVADQSESQRFVDLLNCVRGAGVEAISIKDMTAS